MKLTREKVIELLESLENKINSLEEKRNKMQEDWQKKLFAAKSYRRTIMLITRFQTQYDNLKMKLYSDFRVYTTGERSRDSRFDCIAGHG